MSSVVSTSRIVFALDFESLLKMELTDSKYKTNLDSRVRGVHMDHLIATAQLDMEAENYSYRKDGNNVDIQTENVELASEQIRYSAITDSISQEFSRMKSVLK